MSNMSMQTMLILLVLMFVGYVTVKYRNLIQQNALLQNLASKIEEEHTDIIRRKYNAVARDYNHTLGSFIGKILAKKLKYEKKEMIEKI